MTVRPSTNLLALSVALCGLLLLGAQYYLPFIADDALISLRYAQRLADGHGLTWTDGPRVEGFSNPLWVFLLSGARFLGFDLIQAARALGLALSCATLTVFVGHVLRRGDAERDAAALALSGCFLALAAPMAVWSIGGLEQPLIALAVAVAIAALASYLDGSKRAAGWLTAALVTATWTRPDGILFAAALGAALLWAHAVRWRRLERRDGWIALVLVGALLVQLSLRWAYYGEWLPNTARVKLHPSGDYLLHGLRYVGLGWRSLLPTALVAVLVWPNLLRERAERVWALGLLMIALVWSSYLVVIGGDIFPAYRHFVPLIVVLAFVLADGLRLVLRRTDGLRSSRLGLLVGLIVTAAFAAVQFGDPENRRALEERWEWEGRALGLTLKGAFSEEAPTVAVSAAGCIPYWSELPAIDMLGLNDAQIARAERVPGYPGHEMADGPYVLERRPDLVIFSVGAKEPGFPTGLQMVDDPRFLERYVPVRIRLAAPHPWLATVWMDTGSERIGLRRDGEGWTVPAYLLAAAEGGFAVAGDGGALELQLDAGAQLKWSLPASIRELSLEPSTASLGFEIAGDTLTLYNESASPVRVRSIRLN